jgi:hypothetical protein
MSPRTGLALLAACALAALLLGAWAAVTVQREREFTDYMWGPEQRDADPAAYAVAEVLEEARRITREAT